jgi:hypothetical protein
MYEHRCICIYVYTYINMYTYIYLSIYIYIKHAPSLHSNTLLDLIFYTFTYIYTHIYIHYICMYLYIHMFYKHKERWYENFSLRTSQPKRCKYKWNQKQWLYMTSRKPWHHVGAFTLTLKICFWLVKDTIWL